MEYPKMTPIEYDLNISELSKLIKNVALSNSWLADEIMQKLNKIDRHVQALEIECEAMEGINNGKGTERSPTESCRHTVSSSQVRVSPSDMRSHQP